MYKSIYVTLQMGRTEEFLKGIKLKQKKCQLHRDCSGTATILKNHIPLPKLGLNLSCCIALYVDLYFLFMFENGVFIYSCYQFLSLLPWET